MKLLYILFVLLVAGCSTNTIGFYNPDKTPQQIAMDEAECRNMVRVNEIHVPLNAGGATILGLALESNREDKIYSDCMLSKGYLCYTNKSKSTKNLSATK